MHSRSLRLSLPRCTPSALLCARSQPYSGSLASFPTPRRTSPSLPHRPHRLRAWRPRCRALPPQGLAKGTSPHFSPRRDLSRTASVRELSVGRTRCGCNQSSWCCCPERRDTKNARAAVCWPHAGGLPYCHATVVPHTPSPLLHHTRFVPLWSSSPDRGEEESAAG